MSLMYFVAASKSLFDILLECGCKNILISYFYMPKVGKIENVVDKVDHLFVDSGAHSAKSLGVTIDMDEYYDYLIDNEGMFTTAAHFDVVNQLEPTVNNLKHAIDRGMNWILPVLQQNWLTCMRRFNQVADFEYYGLGGNYMMTSKLAYSLYDAVRRLPKKKYHGFAKVNFPFLKQNLLYSADSSSWVAGARYALITVMEKDGSTAPLNLSKDSANRLTLTRLYELHKEDCIACGIDLELLKQGNNDQLSKIQIATYYRPMLRKMGLFEQNFHKVGITQ